MDKNKVLMTIMAAVLALPTVGMAADQFSVRNAGDSADVMVVTDTGQLALGFNVNNVPNYDVATSLPQGNIYSASTGSAYTAGAVVLEHAATLNASSRFAGTASPNISLYRVNKTGSGVAGYSIPAVSSTVAPTLGYLNFGTLDMTKAQSVAAHRTTTAAFYANAEYSPTNVNAWTTDLTNTPTYFSWSTIANASTASVPVASTFAERMRLTSSGNLGIGTFTGTNVPTSKLHVNGLAYYSSNASALAAGLTSGAFYKCGGNGTAYVASSDLASQSLCVVY